ncbi:Atrial natriuretic peptide receptor 1 [Oopsacas minuta]|uniref:Atrial natriuretic peptide receptor 1 n=1 Tax=Oopsacas minuta TaxID=111878 RepID=A0AAV7JD55_9METZ|nr:Atrial natriuretic peptide receptor 1 [Oopsacas minuta]
MGVAASTGREVQVNRTRDGFRWALNKAYSDMSKLVGEGEEKQASREMCLEDRIIFLESESVNMKQILVRQTYEVQEMERELKEEQNKAKQLMFGQLPYELLLNSPEQLEDSGSLLARKFPMATFIGCDIINFSKLCSLLSPQDMITLLDKIHIAVASAFSDECIYIMERASERCLAVSGLVEVTDGGNNRKQRSPDTNVPSTHAARLATAALKLLSNITAVKVPKYPRSMLQLRVALHSGACHGGVVGLQNISLSQIPHYHIFGTAVDFTRYLSSTSLPLQIRVSSACHQLISSDTDFIFERCPDYAAPNGHNIESFWLLDKKGLDINLPSQFDALPLSECKDIFNF